MLTRKALSGAMAILAAAVVVLAASGFRAQGDELQLGTVPPGAILAYVGPLSANLGPNWVLCDGRQINSPGSIFHQKAVPDLTDNRFLMGVRAAAPVGAGQGGGSNTLSADGGHTHPVSWNGYSPGEINYGQQQGHPSQFQMQYKTASEGVHSHGGDKRPAYMPVHYICRIR